MWLWGSRSNSFSFCRRFSVLPVTDQEHPTTLFNRFLDGILEGDRSGDPQV